MTGTHFPLALATICGNCLACFAFQPVCPACTSEHIAAIETFLTRRREATQRAAFVAEVERAMVTVTKEWR